MRREARSFGEKVHDGPDSGHRSTVSCCSSSAALHVTKFCLLRHLVEQTASTLREKTWSRSPSELFDSNYGNIHTKNITLTLQTLNKIIQLKQTLVDLKTTHVVPPKIQRVAQSFFK